MMVKATNKSINKKTIFKEINIQKNTIRKYYFLIIGLPIVFWAFAFPLIKIGLNELNPINLTILRIFIVCISFILILFFKPIKITKLNIKDTPSLFLLGFFGVICYHFALNYGEQYISAGIASLIITTIPIFIVVLALIFLSEKITLNLFLGILLSLIGVIIISLFGNTNINLEIRYIFAAGAILLAAFFGAFYTVVGKKLLEKYSPLSLTIYAILLGSLGMIPFINDSLLEEVTKLSGVGWGAVIFLAIFPTVISYVLWYVALDFKPASELGVYLYLMPILSTILSFFLLNEKITILFIFGGVLIILGLVIVNKKPIKIRKK
ncbi:MAG: DMT family transporter [Candidatus Thermoplasmatota archaeon]|nr:DMT family transporter [Candidatus Thermoplasmatota archaeon]